MLPLFLHKIFQLKRIYLSKPFYILSFFILTFSTSSFSQVYPVQLSTQLLPPYSGYLPDYGDPTNEKLKCILMLNDFSVTHRDVKLEITITGNGFTIKTNPTFFPSPITIYPGIPEIISGTDLAPYLETQNLIFTGINVNDYEQRKILPEGQYSICIKVIDYYQPDYTVLSNESCTQAWFFLADPPFLNLPLCHSTVTPLQPQTIFFQWTPLNLSSPNSVMNTEYLFELFEVRPASTPPNDIVLTSAPIFSFTTSNSFYNYGIADPVLYTGMQYVWRVRAIDLSGRDYFKNEGYSQICTFTYGNPQNAFGENAFTLTLNGQASTHRQIKWWWNNIANFTEYKLQIRKTGTQNWFDYFSSTSELKVSPLEPSTSYEARVMGMGEGIESDWSNTLTVTTNPPPTIVCNDQNIPINALSAQPLLTATTGMIMQIGQFEMFVTSIAPFGNSPGFYSGFGYVLFYGKKIGVQFDNVYINDNLEITNGNVVALTQGVDAWVDDWILDEAKEDAIYIDGVIDTIYVDADSTITIITEDGDTTTLNLPTNGYLVVNDNSGSQYIIDEDGNITSTTYFEISSDALEATENNQIVFEKSASQQYGLDAFKVAQWHEDYEIIQLSDNSKYFIPNKSLAKNTGDVVRAKIISDIYSSNEVSFQNATGENISHTVIDNSTLAITLPASGESYAVYAMVGSQKLGKLNIRVYEPKNKKVVLVALGNQTLPANTDVENYLNSVYQAGVVHWEVSSGNALTVSDWDENANGKIDIDDYSLLNKYSDEMDHIRHAFDEEVDDDAYILFIVPGFGDETVDGYMPYGRKFGFIKAGANLKTYAHELAHGAFGLQHTFPDIEQGSTDNLLDYGTGNHLATFQWNWMRENHWLENILASQSPYILSQEEMETIRMEELFEDSNTPLPNGFYTPSGKFISANGTFLFTAIEYDCISGGVNKFVYEGEQYVPIYFKYTDGTTLFAGYIKNDGLFRAKEYYDIQLAGDGVSPEQIESYVLSKTELYNYLKLHPEEIFTNYHYSTTGENVLGNYFNLESSVESRKCTSAIIQWSLKESQSSSESVIHFDSENNFVNPLWGAPRVLTQNDIPVKTDGTLDVYYRAIGNVEGSSTTLGENDLYDWYCRLISVFDKGGWGRFQLERLLSVNDYSYTSISTLYNQNSDLIKLAVVKAETFEEFGAAFVNETQIQYSEMKHQRLVNALLSYNVDYGYTESVLNSAENYRAFVQNKFNQLKQNIQTLNQKCEQHVVAQIIKSMTPVEIKLLDVDTRINALLMLAQGTMRGNVNLFGNNEEGNALKLLKHLNTSDYKNVLNKLKSEKIGDGSLLYTLDDHFNDNEFLAGDGNYGLFHRLLIEMSFEVYAKNKSAEQLFNTSEKGSIIYFGEGTGCYYHTNSTTIYTNTGNIGLEHIRSCDLAGGWQLFTDLWDASINEDDEKWFAIQGSFETQNFTYDPFEDWVILIPYENVSDLGLVKNEPTMIPAIGLHFLFQEQQNLSNRLAFRTVLNLVSIVAGGGGLTAGGLTRALAIIDLIGTGADLSLDVFSEELKQMLGPEAYQSLRMGAGILQLTSLGGMGILSTSKIVNNLPQLTNKISGLSIDLTNLSQRTKNMLTKVLNAFGGNVDNGADIVRGVAKDDFFNSVTEFASNPSLGNQAWDLFRQEKWGELEDLISSNNLNRGWPPNNGFKNITHSETESELSGKVFDRFQSYEDLGGGFASPVGSGEGLEDLVFTYDSRALGSQIQNGTYYIKFKLKNDLPSDLIFDYGEAIPWFNTMGDADQIKSSINFSNLIKGTHYEILEKYLYQNGQWISITP